jgi:CRP/FNR family transcriptional regulator, cyclic AMP receptor protein
MTSDIPEVLNQGSARAFPAKNIILFQGEVPRSGFVIKSGNVVSYGIDANGSEQVSQFFAEGDIFPLDWLYSDSRSALFYYEALTPVDLVPISKTDFGAALSDAAVVDYVLGQFRRESSSSAIRCLSLQQPLAQAKIIYLFYYFSLRFGREVMNNVYNLGLPLTHQLIADCLGLTRETVAGELSKLKKSGAVVYKRKQYLVNKKLLIQAVGKEISENITIS